MIKHDSNYDFKERSKTRRAIKLVDREENGHKITALFTEGYPPQSYCDRYGKLIIDEERLTQNEVFDYLNGHDNENSNVDPIEIAWQYYFVHGTPNGSLLKNNIISSNIKKSNELILIHCTTSLDSILKSGYLYPSGGSLGSSIYGVPLRLDNGIHNLTHFILSYELPESLKARNQQKNISSLAIHIKSENFERTNLELNGMDHLMMGKLQVDAYYEFLKKVDLDKEIIKKIETGVVTKVLKERDFLNLCKEYKLKEISNDEFFKYFHKAANSIPFLGYIYFETLIEYITMFQDDEQSLFLKEKGEINNWNHKQMIFEICPKLLKCFRLIEFNPPISKISSYLKNLSKKDKIFSSFDDNRFLDFIKWRISQNIRYKLLKRKTVPTAFTFNNLVGQNPSLMGQMIRSEIAINTEMLNERQYLYDVVRAELIKKSWRKSKTLFPFNAIIPKGEVGINPCFENLEYKIFLAEIDNSTGKADLKKELPIKLASNLVNPDLSTLRFQNIK